VLTQLCSTNRNFSGITPKYGKMDSSKVQFSSTLGWACQRSLARRWLRPAPGVDKKVDTPGLPGPGAFRRIVEGPTITLLYSFWATPMRAKVALPHVLDSILQFGVGMLSAKRSRNCSHRRRPVIPNSTRGIVIFARVCSGRVRFGGGLYRQDRE
jgi:hypothetical protein